MNDVGDRIRSLRKERRWTQIELAEKINVSSQVVSNWERNYTHPDHDDISRLSKAFDVPADYLLGREKDSAEKLIEYLELELTDEEIIDRMNFKVDNITLTNEEARHFIAFVRSIRAMKKEQAAASRFDES